MPATTEQIENTISTLIDSIEDARNALQDGHVRNLEALQKSVSNLCKSISGMKAEDAHQIQPSVLGMISKLEIFEDELRGFHAVEKDKKSGK